MPRKKHVRESQMLALALFAGVLWVNLRSSPTYSKKLQNRREPREATVAPRHSDLVDGLARVLSAFPLPSSVHHEMVARSQRLEQTDVVDL